MKNQFISAILTGALTLFAGSAMSQETLTFASTNSEHHPLIKNVFTPWVEKINASANGAIKIELRNGRMLANHANFYDRVTDDVVQIVWGMTVFNPGKFPRSLVSTMPFLVDSAEQGSVALCKMHEKGAFDAEMGDIVPLIFIEFPQSAVNLNGKTIDDLSDMAGLKIMTTSPTAAAVIKGHGGAPLSILLPEQYEALQRGTADGTIINFTALPGFRLTEVLTDHFLAPLGGAMGMIFMSKDKWDSLSDEARTAIKRHSGCDASREFGKFVDKWEQDTINMMKGTGDHTFTTATPEQIAALVAKMGAGVETSFTSRVPGGAELIKTFREELTAAKQ